MRRVKEAISYEIAKAHVLVFLDVDIPKAANMVGYMLWPEANFRSQGAGGAASRILKRMEKEGLVRWTVTHEPHRSWGWVKINP